jgi:hypothetical protein
MHRYYAYLELMTHDVKLLLLLGNLLEDNICTVQYNGIVTHSSFLFKFLT